MDYYGKRLATCSSDRTIRVFDIDADGNQHLTGVLKGCVLKE
jgi:protein transport protein SEC13